jgi:hypothetical protein
MQQLRTKFLFFYFILTISLLGCSNDPIISGFDSAGWKADYKGCSGTRISQLPIIKANEDKLKGLDEMEIVSLFGKPDRADLRARSQNFYWYYLEGGIHCKNNVVGTDTSLVKQKPLIMKLRFNAVDLVTEVEYTNK